MFESKPLFYNITMVLKFKVSHESFVLLFLKVSINLVNLISILKSLPIMCLK